MKRERWTIEDVQSLPPGEDDRFDRKAFPENLGDLPSLLSKHVSAFANSGGGHLILGVGDKGDLTGCPVRAKGRQGIKEYVERVVAEAVDPPVRGFRVHQIDLPGEPELDPERCLLVIDIEDSDAAPHQCRSPINYYYRVGSESKPAPHFQLELLRGRRRRPSLKIEGWQARALGLLRRDGELFMIGSIDAHIVNTGLLAARGLTTLCTGTAPEDQFRLWPDGISPSYLVRRERERLLPLSRTRLGTVFELHLPRSYSESDRPSAGLAAGAARDIAVECRLIGEDFVGEPVPVPLASLLGEVRFSNAVEHLRAYSDGPGTGMAGWGMGYGYLKIQRYQQGYRVDVDIKNNSLSDYEAVYFELRPVSGTSRGFYSTNLGICSSLRAKEARNYSKLLPDARDLEGEWTLVARDVRPRPTLLLGERWLPIEP